MGVSVSPCKDQMSLKQVFMCHEKKEDYKTVTSALETDTDQTFIKCFISPVIYSSNITRYVYYSEILKPSHCLLISSYYMR